MVPATIASLGRNSIRVRLTPWQTLAVMGPIQHLAFLGGVATGKTFTGAHWSILHFLKYPDLTGFIGANTYDQLSQATLRELFYWLDHYRIQYVMNRLPPEEWGGRRAFPDYHNILSVRHPVTGKPVHAFTRVLSDPDALRGIEFSWYHLDETRDTPENTHDVVLSRMRESEYARGIVTSTTNGQDWCYKRFFKGGDGKLYGSMHVPTSESVRLKIVTEQYYNTLLRSYSPLMALQELDAKHVNVLGGRAYYTASDRNRMRRAPWGATAPTRERPLVIGCDFNFSPAPCIWMVGQLGPDLYSPSGVYFGDCIHWFDEICLTSAATPEMMTAVLARYPNFYYRIFGDASGGKGSTSNAGEHDYEQMGQVLEEAGASYQIDYDQANPIVRNRVENMNAKFLNPLGEVHQTYNPDRCPQLDADLQQVGWKPNAAGKLDDGGDNQRTHASDGAGYVVWKLLPPGRRAFMTEPVSSNIFNRTDGGIINART